MILVICVPLLVILAVSVSFISSIAGGLTFIVCKLLSAKAKQKESEVGVAEDAFNFKHLLLPITDRNPYLSEGTIQVTFL